MPGSPPAPRPRVILSPTRILCGASDWRSACASVLTAMNSTPINSARIMRLTALLPPPPTPITRMSAKFSESDRNGIEPLTVGQEASNVTTAAGQAVPHWRASIGTLPRADSSKDGDPETSFGRLWTACGQTQATARTGRSRVVTGRTGSAGDEGQRDAPLRVVDV